MKRNISIPTDLYKSLLAYLKEYRYEPENGDDCSINIYEIEIGKFIIDLRATYEVESVDDSFDHDFGTEWCSHYEAGDLLYIEDVEVYYYDEETDEEAMLSDLFDYGEFSRLMRE